MKDYFKRLNIFFGERYPLLAGFASAAMAVIGMYLVWTRINNLNINHGSPYLISAVITLFLLTLILRLCDEFKDKEADKQHFPERCLPAGKVKYSDIRKLLYFCLYIFIGINIFWGGSPLLFCGLLIYIYLFYKYFFFPKIISNNLILSLLTHNPLIFLAMVYIISIFNKEYSVDGLSKESFILCFSFWMSSFGWETARKIRTPEQETDYETYSMVLGTRVSCLLPLFAFTSQYFGFLYVTQDLSFYSDLKLYLGVILFIYNALFISFMIRPKSKMAKKFQAITEGYLLVSSLILVWICLVNRG